MRNQQGVSNFGKLGLSWDVGCGTSEHIRFLTLEPFLGARSPVFTHISACRAMCELFMGFPTSACRACPVCWHLGESPCPSGLSPVVSHTGLGAQGALGWVTPAPPACSRHLHTVLPPCSKLCSLIVSACASKWRESPRGPSKPLVRKGAVALLRTVTHEGCKSGWGMTFFPFPKRQVGAG